VTGAPGAAGDARARLVRIVNLRTADEVVAPVEPDGSFRAVLFAPFGSTLQVNTSMFLVEDLPPDIRRRIRRSGWVQVNGLPEPFRHMIGEDTSSSPAVLVPVRGSDDGGWHGFAKKTGEHLWVFGKARLSKREARPGETVALDMECHVRVSRSFFTPSSMRRAANARGPGCPRATCSRRPGFPSKRTGR
jgi:hypothetical protein